MRDVALCLRLTQLVLKDPMRSSDPSLLEDDVRSELREHLGSEGLLGSGDQLGDLELDIGGNAWGVDFGEQNMGIDT